MHWFYPLTLLDALLLGALLLALSQYAFWQWRRGRALRQSARHVFWKLPLRLVTFGLLLTALLGPARGTTRKKIRATGKDVWLLMDLSRSMDAPDVRPTRLERAKAALPAIVGAAGADRVALVAFAGDVAVRCPLTYDQGALLLYARALRTTQPLVPGSELGAALDSVRRKIEDEAAGGGATEIRSPVIVLLTDGEDFGDRAPERDAAVALARARVPVFVLAVGTHRGVPVPGARAKTTRLRLENIDTANEEDGPPITRLHPEALRTLAEVTGGRYFELNDQHDEGRELATALAGLRGQIREVRLLEVAANKYQYPLLLALALLLVDVLVTVRIFRLDE